MDYRSQVNYIISHLNSGKQSYLHGKTVNDLGIFELRQLRNIIQDAYNKVNEIRNNMEKDTSYPMADYVEVRKEIESVFTDNRQLFNNIINAHADKMSEYTELKQKYNSTKKSIEEFQKFIKEHENDDGINLDVYNSSLENMNKEYETLKEKIHNLAKGEEFADDMDFFKAVESELNEGHKEVEETISKSEEILEELDFNKKETMGSDSSSSSSTQEETAEETMDFSSSSSSSAQEETTEETMGSDSSSSSSAQEEETSEETMGSDSSGSSSTQEEETSEETMGSDSSSSSSAQEEETAEETMGSDSSSSSSAQEEETAEETITPVINPASLAGLKISGALPQNLSDNRIIAIARSLGINAKNMNYELNDSLKERLLNDKEVKLALANQDIQNMHNEQLQRFDEVKDSFENLKSQVGGLSKDFNKRIDNAKRIIDERKDSYLNPDSISATSVKEHFQNVGLNNMVDSVRAQVLDARSDKINDKLKKQYRKLDQRTAERDRALSKIGRKVANKKIEKTLKRVAKLKNKEARCTSKQISLMNEQARKYIDKKNKAINRYRAAQARTQAQITKANQIVHELNETRNELANSYTDLSRLKENKGRRAIQHEINKLETRKERLKGKLGKCNRHQQFVYNAPKVLKAA